ncbi:MAG: hypothetical protein U0175_36180 [Caldilineaceae bacterium]
MKTVTRLQDKICPSDLQYLLGAQEEFCVSVYVPVHQPLNDSAHAALRTRQLLRDVEETLLRVLPVTAVEQLLMPIRALNDSSAFWRQIQSGAAFLVSKEVELIYNLPYPCPESATVARHFNIRPLLPMLHDANHFFVLALSQGNVRLYRGTANSINEVAIENAPTNLAEALRYDEFEKQLQTHTTGSSSVNGREATMFHGQGSSSEEAVTKKYLQRFLQELEHGVTELLRGDEVPLITAGVEYIRAIYRQVNRYSNLLDAGIAGNCDHWSAQEFQAAALHVLNVERNTALQAKLHQLAEWLGAGDRRGLANIDSIIRAAKQGRVESLFVTPDANAWGAYDATMDRLEKMDQAVANSEDLVNLAAILTLQTGGKVQEVSPSAMPAQAKVGALLRY